MLEQLHFKEVWHWIKYLTDRIFMEKIRIKQVRSRIGRPKDQKKTLDALGLRKMNSIVEHNATPQILGMVNKVQHLVIVL